MERPASRGSSSPSPSLWGCRAACLAPFTSLLRQSSIVQSQLLCSRPQSLSPLQQSLSTWGGGNCTLPPLTSLPPPPSSALFLPGVGLGDRRLFLHCVAAAAAAACTQMAPEMLLPSCPPPREWNQCLQKVRLSLGLRQGLLVVSGQRLASWATRAPPPSQGCLAVLARSLPGGPVAQGVQVAAQACPRSQTSLGPGAALLSEQANKASADVAPLHRRRAPDAQSCCPPPFPKWVCCLPTSQPPRLQRAGLAPGLPTAMPGGP